MHTLSGPFPREHILEASRVLRGGADLSPARTTSSGSGVDEGLWSPVGGTVTPWWAGTPRDGGSGRSQAAEVKVAFLSADAQGLQSLGSLQLGRSVLVLTVALSPCSPPRRHGPAGAEGHRVLRQCQEEQARVEGGADGGHQEGNRKGVA